MGVGDAGARQAARFAGKEGRRRDGKENVGIGHPTRGAAKDMVVVVVGGELRDGGGRRGQHWRDEGTNEGVARRERNEVEQRLQ